MVSHSTWNIIFQKSIRCFQSTYANICTWPHCYSLTNLLLLGFNLKHSFHFTWKIKHTHTHKKKISKFFHLSLEPKKSQFFHRLLLQPRRVLCCSLIKPCPTLWDLMGCSISGCPSLSPGVCLNSCLFFCCCFFFVFVFFLFF